MCIRDRACIQQRVERAVHDALRTDVHPAAGSHLPVSYTHLDVYQRQDMVFLPVGGNDGVAAGGIAVHLIPVSYTHLDVYKRQPLSCMEANVLSESACPTV